MPRKARDANSADNLKAFLERANRLLDERDKLDSGIGEIEVELGIQMKALVELRERLGKMLGDRPFWDKRPGQTDLAAE